MESGSYTPANVGCSGLGAKGLKLRTKLGLGAGTTTSGVELVLLAGLLLLCAEARAKPAVMATTSAAPAMTAAMLYADRVKAMVSRSLCMAMLWGDACTKQGALASPGS